MGWGVVWNGVRRGGGGEKPVGRGWGGGGGREGDRVGFGGVRDNSERYYTRMCERERERERQRQRDRETER